MPFTAVIEMQPLDSGGARSRAVAMHQTPEDCRNNAETGVHEEWGAAVDQLVALMRSR